MISKVIKCILSYAVIGVWLVFIVRLALRWHFRDFVDIAGYLVIAAITAVLAMAGVSGAMNFDKKGDLHC